MEGNRAVTWRKSSYSGNSGGQCVEVGAAVHLIAVRDSKAADGARLVFGREGVAVAEDDGQGGVGDQHGNGLPGVGAAESGGLPGDHDHAGGADPALDPDGSADGRGGGPAGRTPRSRATSAEVSGFGRVRSSTRLPGS